MRRHYTFTRTRTHTPNRKSDRNTVHIYDILREIIRAMLRSVFRGIGGGTYIRQRIYYGANEIPGLCSFDCRLYSNN